MSSQDVRPGLQSVVPYLTVQRAARLVELLELAFGAQPTFKAPTETHFEVRIGDSMVMVGDVGHGTATEARLFMYIDNANAAYVRAIDAGAASVMEPGERPWGEDETTMRGAAVLDPSGNLRFLAGPIGTGPQVPGKSGESNRNR